MNDKTEAAALAQVFGPQIAQLRVSSTKALHGHLLGAAGAIELAATIVGLERGFAPSNANLVQQDSAIALTLVAPEQGAAIKTALSASYAFGGHNSVLAVGAVA